MKWLIPALLAVLLLAPATSAQAPADTTFTLDEALEQLNLSLEELQEALAPVVADPDPRIEDLLGQLELSFSLTEDNAYKLTLEVGDGRTQLLFINSQTETYQNTEIREIWSPAYRSDRAIQPHLANRLLKESHRKKIGAWQVSKSAEDAYYVTFVAKMPADLDIQSLLNTLIMVVESADEIERELSSSDTY